MAFEAHNRPRSKSADWAKIYRGPGRYQPELLHASFRMHTFARHAHDEYVIAYTEAGVQVFHCLNDRKVVPSGHAFAINPGDAHDDEWTQEGYVYRAFYPCAALVSDAASELSGRSSRLPAFRGDALDDPSVLAALAGFHRAVEGKAPVLQQETRMFELLGLLITRYSDVRCPEPRMKREQRAVRLARELLDAEFARPIPLSELAERTGLSRFHFARTFKAEVGLPVHAYQETRRIACARKLLTAGTNVAEVALAVGYHDQAHFTRRFKSFVGVTPGAYARARTSVARGAAQ